MILLRVTEDHQKSHHAVREVLSLCSDMERRDRAFAKRCAEGTLDYLIRLDYVLGRYSKRPPFLLKPLIRGILRMSLYQLLYMDRVPERAVCSEAVELAKLHGLVGLSGYVNAVLRAAARDRAAHADRLFAVSEPWTELSLPKWLYKKLEDTYGTEGTRSIAESWLCERPCVVRLNRSRRTPEEVEESLRRASVSFKRLPADAFFREHGMQLSEEELPVLYALPDLSGLSGLPAFMDGSLQPQDMSSTIPALLCAPQNGDYILDVCAAPGGKSLQLADMLMQKAETGLIEARDISPKKVELIEENIRRSGFSSIRTRVLDALMLSEDSLFRADIVLADVPCSGLGIAGRKPDIKLNLKTYSISELQSLQRDILQVVSRYVKPHGKLVYSTCTITAEENEENALYIASELGFQLEKQVKVLPSQEHDGFFAALFRRKF